MSEVQNRLVVIKNYLTRSVNDIVAGLPTSMTAEKRQAMADRIRRILTTVAGSKNMQKVTPDSFAKAAIRVAEIGLDPDPVFGHVYLVPYGTALQVIVGYKGYMELGYRSGLVKDFHMAVVWREDYFRYRTGAQTELIHEPNLMVDHADEDRPIAVYAVADLANGGQAHIVLSFFEVEKYRLRSAAVQSSIKYKTQTPWDTDYTAMMMKTAIRRLSARIPQSAETFAPAIKQDDDADVRERPAIEATFSSGDGKGEAFEEQPEAEEAPAPMGLRETDLTKEQMERVFIGLRANRGFNKAKAIAWLGEFQGDAEAAVVSAEGPAPKEQS